MPVRPELFNQELIAPAGQNAEDWNAFTEDQRFHHAHSLKGKLFSALGIDLDAPNPGKDKNGNLVLFELGENGEMRDPLADTPADSKEFLKKDLRRQDLCHPGRAGKPRADPIEA